MRRPKTKIVCTIGPASSSHQVIDGMIAAGLSVARLNFSHGSHADHKEKITLLRSRSEALGRPIAILQDLCGPKIRVGLIPEPGLRLEPGHKLILCSTSAEIEKNEVQVSYQELPREVRRGDQILLADGMMELVVEKTSADRIEARVITGGVLTSHKGINLPASSISVPSMTDKDRKDLQFGLQAEVDYVALSFVRTANDVLDIKNIIAGQGKDTPVIAKIEKHEALDNIDAIIEAADGIMVARGDLGVEIALEEVPNIQKNLVRYANQAGKPAIIATQMLRSMVDAPRPTRAEATDVANAVLDGADAVMLSEETASGAYPVEAVRFMNKIITSTEKRYPHGKYLELGIQKGVSQSVAYAGCVLAQRLGAAAIVATTRSGLTATHLARYRPKAPIVALCPDQKAVRKLALYWGCSPCGWSLEEDTDQMVENAAEMAVREGYCIKGDQLVVTAGRPLWAQGTTNMLWVKTV